MMFNKRFLQALTVFFVVSSLSASPAAFNRMWLERDTTVREAIQDAMQARIDTTPKKEFDDFDENPECATGNPVLLMAVMRSMSLIRSAKKPMSRSGERNSSGTEKKSTSAMNSFR